VLNALAIDPQRAWKGVWRWFADDMLDCCEPLDAIKANGITLEQLACLARCNGASFKLSRPDLRPELRGGAASVLPRGAGRLGTLAGAYTRSLLSST